MYDIIIVGAGTAGLTAAIYGVRAGKSVLVLEAKTYGGQIINTPKIENYPGIKEISGFEYAKICMSRQKIWERRFVLNRSPLLKRQNPGSW